ncbi:MAG: amino acid racemase [Duodenibacillus sp.]|nr:amino acid racemase [Duodenibacillus sp.]
MKRIGIVVGHHQERALALKAAILASDPSADVLLDEETFSADDPAFKKSDCKINNFKAVRRLAARGAQIVAFSCKCPHFFLSEMQKETCTPMADPADGQGELLSAPDYARRILAMDATPLPKPFKIGIIGGLGPAASVDLYDKIVKATPAQNDQQHYKVAVEQNPQTPDRTKCLLEGGEDPTLALYMSAKRLEDDDCDCVIIGCNTAHAFVPGIERHIGIPFVNMQQTTMDEIAARLGDKARIGLMATSGTVKTGIYSDKAKAMGMPIFVPDEAHQELVMRAIYGPQGAKAGFTTGQCYSDLSAAAEYLVNTYDCNVLILGCTELPLIFDEGDMTIAGKTVYIIDPTSALARRVVRMAGMAALERGRL